MRTEKKDEERALEKEALEAKRLKLGIGTTSGIPKSQPTINRFVEKAKRYDPDGAIQEAYDKVLVELISCNLLSFNLVDTEEFHKFVHFLGKRINLKSRATHSRYASKYPKEGLDQFIGLIKSYVDASLSITTDIWTSRSRDS